MPSQVWQSYRKSSYKLQLRWKWLSNTSLRTICKSNNSCRFMLKGHYHLPNRPFCMFYWKFVGHIANIGHHRSNLVCHLRNFVPNISHLLVHKSSSKSNKPPVNIFQACILYEIFRIQIARNYQEIKMIFPSGITGCKPRKLSEPWNLGRKEGRLLFGIKKNQDFANCNLKLLLLVLLLFIFQISLRFCEFGHI